jgi:hypothetical protein
MANPIKCFLLTLLGLASCLDNASAETVSPQTEQTKPNVVLIFADDQMWNSLGLL